MLLGASPGLALARRGPRPTLPPAPSGPAAVSKAPGREQRLPLGQGRLSAATERTSHEPTSARGSHSGKQLCFQDPRGNGERGKLLEVPQALPFKASIILG